MRIAIFTETYLPQINGVVTHIKILKEGLEALGHTVLIVTADAKAGTAVVSMKPGTDEEAIKAAVAKAGYVFLGIE